MVVGHVAPEAFVGGPIALIREGDSVTIDAHQLLLQLNVSDEENGGPSPGWVPPAALYTRCLPVRQARQHREPWAVTDAFEA